MGWFSYFSETKQSILKQVKRPELFPGHNVVSTSLTAHPYAADQVQWILLKNIENKSYEIVYRLVGVDHDGLWGHGNVEEYGSSTSALAALCPAEYVAKIQPAAPPALKQDLQFSMF